jgi:integrase
MASAWIIKRSTEKDGKRYLVRYRLGGRESATLYGGSFKKLEEARSRKKWLNHELAEMRVPDLAALLVKPQGSPTFAEACERWRATRVDVTEPTRVLHRVALARALPLLGTRRIDEIVVADVNALVAKLAEAGKARETIRKTVKYSAAVLDDAGVDPNPFRDKRIRLPYEEGEEIVPPVAGDVEAVFGLLARPYRLALLFLDWSGTRVAAIDSTLVGDYDEQARRVRLRAATTKSRKALWVSLPDALADALEASLPPREDRDVEAQLFAGASADRLRTAIARACKAAGIAVFSPHDLRHRRISLLHAQGRSWAEIGALVGQKKLSVTSDVYTHVLLGDAREVDYEKLLGSMHAPMHARRVTSEHV